MFIVEVKYFFKYLYILYIYLLNKYKVFILVVSRFVLDVADIVSMDWGLDFVSFIREGRV